TNIIPRNLRLMARNARNRRNTLPRLKESTQEISNFKNDYSVHNVDSVNVAIESRSSHATETGAALVEIRALDTQGNRKTIPGWAYVSARVGEYHYLAPQGENNTSLTQFTINLPAGAATLELVGHTWKKAVATEIVGPVLFWSDKTGPLRQM